MARKTSGQAKEEPHKDARLLPHLRYHRHHHRRRHRLAGAAFVVPEWGEARFPLNYLFYGFFSNLSSHLGRWDGIATTKDMMHRMDLGAWVAFCEVFEGFM